MSLRIRVITAALLTLTLAACGSLPGFKDTDHFTQTRTTFYAPTGEITHVEEQVAGPKDVAFAFAEESRWSFGAELAKAGACGGDPPESPVEQVAEGERAAKELGSVARQLAANDPDNVCNRVANAYGWARMEADKSAHFHKSIQTGLKFPLTTFTITHEIADIEKTRAAEQTKQTQAAVKAASPSNKTIEVKDSPGAVVADDHSGASNATGIVQGGGTIEQSGAPSVVNQDADNLLDGDGTINAEDCTGKNCQIKPEDQQGNIDEDSGSAFGVGGGGG